MEQAEQAITKPENGNMKNNSTVERGYISQLFSALAGLWRARDSLHFTNIRPRSLWYFLAFPLSLTFVNVQEILFQSEVHLWGMDAETVIFSAYCLGAGLLFALASIRNIMRVARISAILSAVSFIPWLFLPDGTAGLLFAALFMFGMGGSVACASFAYTFALNNTERFWGTILISFFYALVKLGSSTPFLPPLISKAILTALVAGTVLCLLRFQTHDFAPMLKKPKAKWNPAIGLTLYFFIASYALEYFYGYLPGSSGGGAMFLYGIFGLAAVALSVLIQMVARRSVWHMCNLFFVFMLGMMGCFALFAQDGSVFWRDAAAALHGLQQIGYTVTFYFLGCVFKKHGDFRLFKLSLVAVVLGSVLTYILPDTLAKQAPSLVLPVAFALSGLVFMVFLLLSPAYSRYLFNAGWSDDFTYPDMTEAGDKVENYDRLQGMKLSPREKEVASRLLHGLSAKQISHELSVSVNTVNFHIKNLYKKLGVNGRLELFARFGVTVQNEAEASVGTPDDVT